MERFFSGLPLASLDFLYHWFVRKTQKAAEESLLKLDHDSRVASDATLNHDRADFVLFSVAANNNILLGHVYEPHE